MDFLEPVKENIGNGTGIGTLIPTWREINQQTTYFDTKNVIYHMTNYYFRKLCKI